MTWLARRTLQPLDRLEQGVLDSSTPLAGLLRLALIRADALRAATTRAPASDLADAKATGYPRAQENSA
ncbi:hypothetical protein [Streptomyces sp. NPDC057426]|uniref:hypothetical protein n=1 Tax=Streptomyces sp. NPDC057426 TaxID=3346128 RepID=UPI00368372D3